MEKVNFKNSRQLNLVGNFWSTESNKIIILAHGFTGDKSEWGRFDKYCQDFYKAGFNVLAFDFSGCGESDDDSLTVDKQVDDLQAAINFVKEKEYKAIGIFGHSLAGLVILKLNSSDVKGVVFTAPVTNKVKYTWDKRYNPKELQELKEKNYITLIRDKGVRKKIIIDQQILKDREEVNQKELLQDINIPVLIIHGDQDKSIPLEDSKKAVKILSNAKLEILPGSGHDFQDDLTQVSNLSINWFKKYL